MNSIQRFPSPSEVPANLIQEAQKGRWHHWKRLFLIQTSNEVCVIALNSFQRLAAAFLKVLGVDYFAKKLGEKRVNRIDPFAKIIKKDAHDDRKPSPVRVEVKPQPPVAHVAPPPVAQVAPPPAVTPSPSPAKAYDLDEQIQAIHRVSASNPTKKICLFLGRGAEQTVPQHPDEIWISLDITHVNPLDPNRIHLQMNFNDNAKMALLQGLFDKAVLDQSVMKFMNANNPWSPLKKLLKKDPQAELVTETFCGLLGVNFYRNEADAGKDEGGGLFQDVHYPHIMTHTPEQIEACKRRAIEKANATNLQFLQKMFQTATLVRQQPFPCQKGLHDYFVMKGPKTSF